MKLYVKSWCSWCISAKRYLDQRGYKYEEVDVLSDAASYDEMRRLSSQSLTPTLVADGRVLADFGPDELEVFLKQHNIDP